MFKVGLLIAFAFVAGAHALQEGLAEDGGRPEPYAYAYDADSHQASEQKDPNGRVSGYYTLVGEDGRQRRVDYVADEGGFRAKVQTNEVGTKSENAADVEVLASPPTPDQLRQQTIGTQQSGVLTTTAVGTANRLNGAYTTGYQRYGNGYGYYGNGAYGGYGSASYPGYGYANSYYTGYGAQYPGYASYAYNTAAYPAGYAYNNGYGYNNGLYGYAARGYSTLGNGLNYNYHTPGSYYRNVASYSVAGAPQGQIVGRVANGGAVSSTSSIVRGYQTVVPAGGFQNAAYQTVGYQTPALAANSGLAGSSNYIVLKKKRDAEAAAAAPAAAAAKSA